MSILSQALNGTSAILLGFLALPLAGALAQGSDSGRLPPPPLPVPTAASSAPAPAAAAPAEVIPAEDLKVVAGAGEDKRKALLGRIMVAKSQGIGISTYMMAFDALEQQAKNGDSEENVGKRVASLNSSLDEQFKRSAILKVQRPSPPIAASDPAVPFGSAGGGGGGIPKNTDTASLIQKLQNKYGSQIPENMKGQLGGGDTSSLLKNPEIQDLLKKYGK